MSSNSAGQVGPIVQRGGAVVLKPWDMQPNESPQAYEAFAVYRDLGAERTWAKAAAIVGKSVKTFNQWAHRHSWTERIRAYEQEVSAKVNRVQEETIADIRARHAQAAKLTHSLYARRVATLAARSQRALAGGMEDPFEDIGLTEAARGLQLAGREEREARGMLPIAEDTGAAAIIAIVRMSVDDL